MAILSDDPGGGTPGRDILNEARLNVSVLGLSAEDALSLEMQLRALEQLATSELPALVGLPAVPTPRAMHAADLLTLLELYAKGRTLGCEPIESARLAAAELWVAMEREAFP